MTENVLNKQQRKKARRKERKRNERQAHRSLDVVTSEAVAEALRLAPMVVDAASLKESDHVIDVELASASEAQFVRKRVNDALKVAEWLDDVSVWIWQADEHVRDALSERGRASGLELRIERSVSS